MEARLARAEANVERMTRAMTAAAESSNSNAGATALNGQRRGNLDVVNEDDEDGIDGVAIPTTILDLSELRSDTEDSAWVPPLEAKGKGKETEVESSDEDDSIRGEIVLCK